MRNKNWQRTLLAVTLALLMLLGAGGVLTAAPGLQDDGQAGEEIGVLITSVQRGSPAARAGIARGDIILAAGDATTDTVDELVAAITAATPGDEVVFTIQHGSETLERTVTLGERNGVAYLGVVPYIAPAVQMQEETVPATETPVPAEEAAPATATPAPAEEMTPEAEAEATAAPAEEGAGEGAGLTDGAVVGEVVPDSPAALAGLTEGDVIVAVNDEPVTVDNDLAAIIGQLQPGDEVRLTVRTMQEDDEIILVATLGANPQDETRPFLGVRYGMLAALMEEAPAATPTPEAEEEPAATPTPEAEEEPAATATPAAEEEATAVPAEEEAVDATALTDGAVIGEVVPESPAARAGLAEGDVVVAVNDEPVTVDNDLATIIGQLQPGDEVRLTVRTMQDDDEIILVVTLGANPQDETRPFLGVRYGMLATLMEEAPAATPTPEAEEEPAATATPETEEEAPAATATPEAEEEPAATATAEAVEEAPAATATPQSEEESLVIPRLEMTSGALIVEVVPDSPAAAAGLQPGDVIAAVDGTAVAGERDLAALIGGYAPGDEVELSVVSPGDDGERIVSLALGENPDDSSKAFLGVRYSPLGAPGMGSLPFRRGQMIPPETPRRDAPATPDDDCDCPCECDRDGRHRHYRFHHHGDEGMMPFGHMMPDGEMPPGIMPFLFHHFGDIDPENLPPELREFLEEFGNQ